MQSAVAISYQGRRNVARSNPAAKSWGVFMRSHLARLKMSQADFQRLMDAADCGVSKQTVSQWANGENAPDANTALAVAQVMGARDVEALRAAGFDPVADRIEHRASETEPTEPIDPVIQEIMALPLGAKVRQALVAQYLADQEEVRRRARNTSKMMAEHSGSADSAA